MRITKYLKTSFNNNKSFITDLINDLGGYKKYVALLSQTSTNAPTARILENTLGNTPVLARTGGGIFTITLSQALKLNKTWVVLDQSNIQYDLIGVTLTSENVITLTTESGNDGILLNTAIEIRVYP